MVEGLSYIGSQARRLQNAHRGWAGTSLLNIGIGFRTFLTHRLELAFLKWLSVVSWLVPASSHPPNGKMKNKVYSRRKAGWVDCGRGTDEKRRSMLGAVLTSTAHPGRRVPYPAVLHRLPDAHVNRTHHFRIREHYHYVSN